MQERISWRSATESALTVRQRSSSCFRCRSNSSRSFRSRSRRSSLAFHGDQRHRGGCGKRTAIIRSVWSRIQDSTRLRRASIGAVAGGGEKRSENEGRRTDERICRGHLTVMMTWIVKMWSVSCGLGILVIVNASTNKPDCIESGFWIDCKFVCNNAKQKNISIWNVFVSFMLHFTFF